MVYHQEHKAQESKVRGGTCVRLPLFARGDTRTEMSSLRYQSPALNTGVGTFLSRSVIASSLPAYSHATGGTTCVKPSTYCSLGRKSGDPRRAQTNAFSKGQEFDLNNQKSTIDNHHSILATAGRDMRPACPRGFSFRLLSPNSWFLTSDILHYGERRLL